MNQGSATSSRATIFANGRLGDQPRIPTDELIIAADGGAAHCLELGLIPSAVIGDMDSINEETKQRLVSSSSQLIHYPTRKDHTDLELALKYAIDQGARTITIVAALGARWDQTLANLLLPASREFDGINIRLVDGVQEIQVVQPGSTVTITGQPGDTLSLIPIAGESAGVTTEGLEYALHDENLEFGSTRGISNVLVTERAQVSLRSGKLILVHIQKH